MKNVLALLADFANGMFAVLLAAAITETEILWWYYLVGILLAMLPDLDAISELLSRGKVAASNLNGIDHREGLHYPLLFVFVGVTASWYLGFWGYVFLFATTLHFVNDFYGTGWGIKVLWPFSNRNYKLLGRRVNRPVGELMESGVWETISEDEKRLRLIVSWGRAELPQYIERWGMDDWIEKYYLRLNWISAIEYCLFVVACTLAIASLI